MRFLHAADLHLDAQLKGLGALEEASAEVLRAATRGAFENLVALAIRERVDFVIIAGDLFDREWNEVKTWLFAKTQFLRLRREQIPVYLIRGNHDFKREEAQRLEWPDNVCEFGSDAPSTVELKHLHVALHGQSFGAREVTVDLAEKYPDPLPGAFNIGLLHTSLSGATDHETYAPTRPEILALKGYDYWALGHVHTHRIEREEPAIVYPGCTQGRHANETGAKGCVLVTVEGRSLSRVEFRPLDKVRWQRVTIEATPEDHLADLCDRVRRTLDRCREELEGRWGVVRLVVAGPCGCHAQFMDPQGRAEAVSELRTAAFGLDRLCLEKIDLQTTPPVDVARLRAGQDLLGELLRDIEHLLDGPDADLVELALALEPLAVKGGAELAAASLTLSDPALVRNWLRQAEGRVVSALSHLEETP